MNLTLDDRTKIFDKVCRLVATKHFDPAMNGADWNALVKDRRGQILACADAETFEKEVHKLVAELKTSHTGFRHAGMRNIPARHAGKRGPSTGVRISAKRQRSPLVLSPEQVKCGLAELEFRDQLLVFLEGALGIRQGELGALRWLECDFENMSFSVQHSYYWRRGGNLKSTKTEASAKLLPMHPSLKHSLQEWRSQSLYNKPEDFVFPSERLQGSKPLDLASVLKKKIQPAFRRIGITGVGWHTFRHSVGSMLAEMGEHQLTIRDYLRHSLHVTNKYLQ